MRSFFSINYIQPALQQNLIEMTIPDKPNSRSQKYRLTEKGRALKIGVAFDKFDETGGQTGGQIGDALTDRQQKILYILEDDPHITRAQLSQKLQINESAILKHLNSLKKKGIIERIGGTRGYWKNCLSLSVKLKKCIPLRHEYRRKVSQRFSGVPCTIQG